MTFVPEDGTGLPDANSYCDVAYADAFLSARGILGWPDASTEDKQSALVRATDYMDQKYGGRVLGNPLNDEQALAFPTDSFGLPAKVKNAACLLAAEALTADLSPIIEQGVKKEKVDVLEVEYQDGSSAVVTRPAIDGLMRPYLRGRSINIPVVRV